MKQIPELVIMYGTAIITIAIIVGGFWRYGVKPAVLNITSDLGDKVDRLGFKVDRVEQIVTNGLVNKVERLESQIGVVQVGQTELRYELQKVYPLIVEEHRHT